MDLIREVPGFNGKFVIVIKGETATCWNTNWRNTGKTNSNYRNKAQLNRKDMSKAVAQYTLNGDFVAWYPSAMEAERQLGIYKLNARISENCNNKRDTASGYIWRYA